MIHVLRHEQKLPISLEEAWAFFSNPRNLDAITPDDMGFRIETCHSEEMHEGQIITYRIRVAPGVRLSWVTEIKSVEPGRSFVDEQRFGPYKFWHHRHTFEEIEGGVSTEDLVHYAVPFGILGEPARRILVAPRLRAIFDFRRRALEKRFGRMP